MASETKMNQSKGMKGRKKAEKDKALARRAAAASKQSELKNKSKVAKGIQPVVVEEISVKDRTQHAAGPAIEVASGLLLGTQKIEHNVSEVFDIPVSITDASFDTNTVNTVARNREVTIPVSIAHKANIPNVINIQAERKKLEAKLYDSMESAQKRFARLSSTASATAEYNYGVFDIGVVDKFYSRSHVHCDKPQRAIDSNGFACMIVRNPEAGFAKSLDKSGDHDHVALSVENLFATVKAEGLRIVRLTDVVEAPFVTTVAQLFDAVKTEGVEVARRSDTPGISAVYTAGTQAQVEADVVSSHKNENLLDLSLVDSAIVTCKVQAPS